MPLTNLLIGLAVLAWLIHRQLQIRSLKDRSRGVILVVLGIYGQILRQGTWLTATLWVVVAVVLHLLADRLITNSGGPTGLGSASLLSTLRSPGGPRT